MDLNEALSSHPDLARLPGPDLEVLSKAFNVEEHETGHAFIVQGDRSGAAWLILQGEVAVTRAREPYIDELVRLGPGELFGLASLVSGVRRTASCSAAGPIRVARIDKSTLDALMREEGPIGLGLQRAVMRQLASDYRHVAANLRDLLEKRG
jgi:CRP-like cAMP-binding protein